MNNNNKKKDMKVEGGLFRKKWTSGKGDGELERVVGKWGS
jgi:hypothetical protein